VNEPRLLEEDEIVHRDLVVGEDSTAAHGRNHETFPLSQNSPPWSFGRPQRRYPPKPKGDREPHGVGMAT
jgi:hypothetical protein